MYVRVPPIQALDTRQAELDANEMVPYAPGFTEDEGELGGRPGPREEYAEGEDDESGSEHDGEGGDDEDS